MTELRRELAEKEKRKKKREEELAREVSILDETRGEINEENWARISESLFYIDIEIGKKAKGRMLFELFQRRAPRFCRSFLASVLGDIKGSIFSRIEPGIKCTIDLRCRPDFDNDFILKHTNTGLLTASPKREKSVSILFEEQPNLDGHSLVFGRLINGFAILRAIELLAHKSSATGAGATHVSGDLVRITDCAPAKKFDSLKATLDSYEAPLVLPKAEQDLKNIARNYRNKNNYYDTSSRSALFSWNTST
mmetsp:Transcript_10376/g.15662  ORF Transcript_10376/g.15662 Transcript_10376/m.15662 type:complete len:251 (-) Transcript_10376:1271-2023(-)